MLAAPFTGGSSLRVFRLAAALSLLHAAALAEEPAPAAPAQPAGAATAPVTPDLKALFERELGALPPVELVTPGGVRGNVEAAAPVEVTAGKDETEQLTIALGSSQPLHCTLSRGRADAAASIGGLVESVGKHLEVVSARPVEVSSERGAVILFAEVLYRQNTEQGPLAGQFKIAVHPRGARSLLCIHDEPGYSTTFRRVVKGLAGSLTGGDPDEAAQARFAEVLLTEVAGLQVGFVERQIWERPDGGRTAVTYESMLLPRSAKDLVGIDQFTREESDRAGLLTAVQAGHAVNGEVDLEVQLDAGAAAKTFEYKGQKAGKAIEGTFRAREGLASELWFAKRLTARKPAPKLVHDTYSAGADPTAPTRLTYTRDPRSSGRATLTVGPMTVKGELDEHGLMKAFEIPVGSAALGMKRVWSRGAP